MNAFKAYRSQIIASVIVVFTAGVLAGAVIVSALIGA